jgi:AcrR family transcriptional regulator
MTGATKRLTRAESRERTRARIIDAATQLFLRDGFRATSLEQVAEVAGHTVGAVYSNFEGKTAMGIAVIDELYAREQQRLAESLAAVPAGDREALFAALSSWADSTIGDPAWTRLEIEIAAFSAHEEAHRAATAARYARLRAGCRELIAERVDGDLTLDPDTLATAIVGLALGIGAQRAADPRIPGSAWSDVLHTLVATSSSSSS